MRSMTCRRLHRPHSRTVPRRSGVDHHHIHARHRVTGHCRAFTNLDRRKIHCRDQSVAGRNLFGVQLTDVDGPVFVNAKGMTLYRWPLNNLRNGNAGDRKGGTPGGAGPSARPPAKR